MKTEMITRKPETLEVDLLAVGMFEDDLTPGSSLKVLDDALEGQISAVLEDKIFKGKKEETALLHTFRRIPARKILLMGLGKKEKFDKTVLRDIAALLTKKAKKEKCLKIGFWPFQKEGEKLPLKEYSAARFIKEGLVLGLYEFKQYKAKEEEEEDIQITAVKIVMDPETDNDDFTKGIKDGKSIAEGICFSRDLVNEPANKMTPENLALEAEAMARRKDLKVEIMDREELEKLEMGCFLGVAQGSIHEPKMVVLRYEGASKDPDQVIGLIGKGLTFDTGGISLKPAAGMEEMKTDMAGAAAVMGAMSAIADIRPPVNVIAILGICENMPSHRAYRPGDILKAMNGKTVEVLNTDAEGRLVLADCLTFAGRLGATHLIDAATLTGACVIALGNHYTGVLSNNSSWRKTVLEAGEAAGERLWPLPLDEVYKDQLKSDVADLANVGGRPAGAITAGMFLEAFVDERPWVHLDIAGTARTSKPASTQQKGATGAAVATLVQAVSDFSDSHSDELTKA